MKKWSLVSFICEAKSVSKQDVLIMAIFANEIVQWTETMISKLATIHWIVHKKVVCGDHWPTHMDWRTTAKYEHVILNKQFCHI